MKLYALLAMVSLVSPVQAADGGGLEPCRDAFSESFRCYYEAVQSLLLPEEIGASEPSARMVVIPSFEAEWVVALFRSGNFVRVELRQASREIWRDSDLCSGALPAGVEAIRRKAPLPGDLAKAIADVWKEALLHLDSPRDPWSRGSDGVTYYASAWVAGHGTLCGETWSPGGGIGKRLVAIAHGLRAHAENPSDATETALWNLVQGSDEEVSRP